MCYGGGTVCSARSAVGSGGQGTTGATEGGEKADRYVSAYRFEAKAGRQAWSREQQAAAQKRR